MPPTAKQLIECLMQESRYFIRLALVISCENETAFIWNDNPNSLGELNKHVEAGGRPFATMGYVVTSEGYGFHARLLAEYRGDPSFEAMLDNTLENVRQQLESEGFKTRRMCCISAR
jgi:hypothetical protein